MRGAWALLLFAAAACGSGRGGEARSVRPFHRLPPSGTRILVLAPHPDDEILGAGGLMETAVLRGATVHVVVATDGEHGPDRVGAGPGLAATREIETRQAAARIGLGADALSFLGYADGSLAAAWGERWTASPRDGGAEPADAIVDALRSALDAAAPDTLVLPLTIDAHPDHAALARFALLAVLAESSRPRLPEILGYLIHGHRQWPAHGPDPMACEPPPDGCAGSLFPWAALVLDPAEVMRKASLIEGFRSQIGRSRRLFRYASRDEPFARGEVVRAPRATAPSHPGVHRTAHGVVARVPRGGCTVEPDAGDRIRLRFLREARVEERLVRPNGETPQGGVLGAPFGPASDVRVVTHRGAIRLELGGALADARGAVVEILPGGGKRDYPPAWLLLW